MKGENQPPTPHHPNTHTCGFLSSACLWGSSLLRTLPCSNPCILHCLKYIFPGMGRGPFCFLSHTTAAEGPGRKGRYNWGGGGACSVRDTKHLFFLICKAAAVNPFQEGLTPTLGSDRVWVHCLPVDSLRREVEALNSTLSLHLSHPSCASHT